MTDEKDTLDPASHTAQGFSLDEKGLKESKVPILGVNTENVMAEIDALYHQNLSAEETDTLIDALQSGCLSKINLLEKVQLHLRGDCRPIESRLPIGRTTVTGSVCNKKLELSTDEKRIDALHALMASLVERYNIAHHFRVSYKGSSFITFGLSEDFDNTWGDKPVTNDAMFYGDAEDSGHAFTILGYIDMPKIQESFFENPQEEEFGRRPSKDTMGYLHLLNRKGYLFALMLASAILNNPNIASNAEEIERRKLEAEREVAERIQLQEHLTKTSLSEVLAGVTHETRRNKVLSYLIGRFDQYNLAGYALIRLSPNTYRFIFPHGQAYLEDGFKPTSALVVPEESLLVGRETLVEIENADDIDKIITPILDKFVQLVIDSGGL